MKYAEEKFANLLAHYTQVLMSRRSVAMDSVDAARYNQIVLCIVCASLTAESRHSGGYQPSAPPPISNYKGVMLCDRPNTLKTNLSGRGADGEAMPFTNMVGPGMASTRFDTHLQVQSKVSDSIPFSACKLGKAAQYLPNIISELCRVTV